MDVVSYKCPNCSAPLAFDIDKQNWHCNFCHDEFDKETLDQLEKAASSEVQEAATGDGETERQYGANAMVYSCPSCGGSIVTEQNTVATFCVFCHSPAVIASRLSDEKQPEKVIPFKLKKEAAAEALQNLCKKKPFLPPDFRDYGMKGEVSGLYVPYWLFDLTLHGVLEGRGNVIRTWSDSRYRYTKTDTYRFSRVGTVGFKGVPADASKRMDDRLMEALEPFDYRQMDDFTMEYLSGHFAESFDVGKEESEQRVVNRVRGAVSSMLKGTVTGYTGVSYSQDHIRREKTKGRYVMFPVWVLMVPYKGSTYTFAMNGQTGKISGKLPLDSMRVALFFAGLTGAVALLCFLGGMIL